MKRYAAIAAVVVLLVTYLVWRSQTEQVIKRRSKSLIEMADQVSGGVGMFDLNRLEGLLADQLSFQIEVVSKDPQTANAAEVLSGYLWMAEHVEKSDFSIKEFQSVQITGKEARVKCRVKGVLEMPDIRMMDGEYQVEFGWRKDDKGDWRLVELLWR